MHPIDHIFDDDEFDRNKYLQELMNTKNENIKWCKEEFNIQLKKIMLDFAEKTNNRVKAISIRLLPYFHEVLDDENNNQTRFLAEKGIKKIKNTSPDIFNEYMVNPKKFSQKYHDYL